MTLLFGLRIVPFCSVKSITVNKQVFLQFRVLCSLIWLMD